MAITVGDAVVYFGDCRDVLKTLPNNSVDSVVTDPPYELGFMGKKWDSTGIAYDVTVWAECLRVLKPGGHIVAFGGSRTFHRLAVAIEDSGFEIRDTIAWISSKTFPKSLNVGKAMAKAGFDSAKGEGWGTGLKQVVEPVVLGRKPLEDTVAENFDRWGVGGLNIDGSRIAANEQELLELNRGNKRPVGENYNKDTAFKIKCENRGTKTSKGRWPANVILDEYTAELLDQQSGVLKSGRRLPTKNNSKSQYNFTISVEKTINTFEGDSGGASRFFYVAKASKRDRNQGVEETNFHPTVKPTALMTYLIKLVTPAGGTVLDPFTGSGSTGKAALLDGYKFIGAELTEEYLPIIEGRLKWAVENRVDDETLF